MDPNEPMRAAADAGTATIVRDLVDSGIADISRRIAAVSQGRVLAFRHGLMHLRERVPEAAVRMIDLEISLGVRDPTIVADRVAKLLLTNIGAVSVSLSKSFRGVDAPVASQESNAFRDWLRGFVLTIPPRALTAVQLQVSKDIAMGPRPTIQNNHLPMSQSRPLAGLLELAEGPSLDWKKDFPIGVQGGRKHPQRDDDRGKFLKSLVSIANSVVDERGYLVYGVDDTVTPRKVVGIQVTFDDATFQDWNTNTFEPPVQFSYREQDHDGKRVAVFEVMPSSAFPHVCKTDVGSELRTGQVWFRRGSRNSVAAQADLKGMFAPAEPLRTTEGDGALVKQVRAYWEPLGWEPVWPRMDERDEKLAQGLRLAYAPESRREIRLSQSNVDVHVLMLRRK